MRKRKPLVQHIAPRYIDQNVIFSDQAHMANLTLSLVLAYVMAGISQVTEDLAADPVRRPIWAIQPTFGKMLLIGITWFTRPFVEAANARD